MVISFSRFTKPSMILLNTVNYFRLKNPLCVRVCMCVCVCLSCESEASWAPSILDNLLLSPNPSWAFKTKQQQKKGFIYLCVWTCVKTCALHALEARRQHQTHRNWSYRGCMSPCGSWKQNPLSLQKREALSITESSFQPPSRTFYIH